MEKDWKLFRKKLGGWQESYMDKLVEEYKSIMEGGQASKIGTVDLFAKE